VTVWIPLMDVPAGGTGLVFCSRSHADFALPYWNPISESNHPRSPWNRLEERYNIIDDAENLVDYMPLALGDVTVHSGWTLHCADGNKGFSRRTRSTTSGDRLALAISYVDARAPIRPDAMAVALSKDVDDNLSSYRGDNEDAWSFRDWVREIPVGTPNFVHPSVPILWPPPSIRPKRTNANSFPADRPFG
jgi:hypothetical protein